MGWYKVIKKINGHKYNYMQRTWRENGKVRTESYSLGRVNDDKIAQDHGIEFYIEQDKQARRGEFASPAAKFKAEMRHANDTKVQETTSKDFQLSIQDGKVVVGEKESSPAEAEPQAAESGDQSSET